MTPALELEEAQARLLALAPEMPVEYLPVPDALGRYLAHDLYARRTDPVADLSAMDGYAICGESPWKRIGESRAGTPFVGIVGEGQAVRISTGAHVPDGADRILIQENTVVDGDIITLASDMPAAGRHIRHRGFNFEADDRIIDAGTRLGPAQMALALGAGHGSLEVRRAPHVAIIDSGDELASDPEACRHDQIPATNGAMLAAMLAPTGCRVTRIGPVPDDRAALAKALTEAEAADILVTSGGASVGDHDLVKPALQDWGAALGFWKVAMKPGKPLLVATRASQVIVGLPGNPVSSFVTGFLFVLPLIRNAMGAALPLPRRVRLPLAQGLAGGGLRREFLRAVWDGEIVSALDSRDSSALRELATANCLVERSAGAAPVASGSLVDVYPLQIGSIA